MKPYITANKLAAFITARSPDRRRSIVRTLQRSTGTDFPQYYSSLREPARRFVADGARTAAELEELIERMADRGRTRWLETDGRITSEAARSLLASAPLIHALPYRCFLRPSRAKAIWSHPQVDVSITPDLLVSSHGQAPPSGAMRFYIAKDTAYELGERGAQLVATLVHLWQRSLRPEHAVAEHCFVLECFQQRLTVAPADPTKLEIAINRGCEDFARLWHNFEADAAA